MTIEQSNDIEQKVLCAIHNFEPTTHDEIVSETHIPRDDVKTPIKFSGNAPDGWKQEFEKT